eukprot:SAG11_NODE_613_length_8205_cov_28.925487_5_plen_70_part_00
MVAMMMQAKAEAHISASYYKARWASLSNEELMEAQKLLSQQSGWGFGNSDFDCELKRDRNLSLLLPLYV